MYTHAQYFIELGAYYLFESWASSISPLFFLSKFVFRDKLQFRYSGKSVGSVDIWADFDAKLYTPT